MPAEKKLAAPARGVDALVPGVWTRIARRATGRRLASWKDVAFPGAPLRPDELERLREAGLITSAHQRPPGQACEDLMVLRWKKPKGKVHG